MYKRQDTRTPQQRKADRAKLREWTQEQGIELKTYEDVQALFRDFVAMTLEGGLEAELDEELGYSKYDYRNKETDNSRNGYSKKTVKSSLGDIELSIPRDRKGEFEPQLVKKNQTTLSLSLIHICIRLRSSSPYLLRISHVFLLLSAVLPGHGALPANLSWRRTA